MRRRPDLVAGRVVCFDRNFPGYDLITAILHAGGHVVACVKEDISLLFDGQDRGWLPGESRLTWLNAPSGKKEDRMAVRAAEHNVILPGGDGKKASQTCTLSTTLLDHQDAPADAVRETYLTRWSAGIAVSSFPFSVHESGLMPRRAAPPLARAASAVVGSA